MNRHPVVVDGKMFVTGPWSKVFAFDAKTGKPLWTFDPGVDHARGVKACCDVVNRGVAFWKGQLFLGTIDGRLISLDAATGEEIWSEQTLDKKGNGTITGFPPRCERQGRDRLWRRGIWRARLCHRL